MAALPSRWHSSYWHSAKTTTASSGIAAARVEIRRHCVQCPPASMQRCSTFLIPPARDSSDVTVPGPSRASAIVTHNSCLKATMSTFDNDDFLQVAAQLLQMSIADSQAYVNYLSSRLRVMASLFFGRNVATHDPEIYTWFTENMFRELTNAITVLGCLTSGSRVLEVPQYLRRCMRGHPHLSKRYSDNDSDIPDSPIDGLGEHWYTQIPLRPEVPKMNDLLTTWSRQNLMAEMTTALTLASLSDEGLLSLKSAYEKYREILRAAIEQETARYNQLIEEREAFKRLSSRRNVLNDR
ncbi:hypothetical protein BDZ97DRAFT_1930928 [Flammula alnicola]|nr:hypothetical protein BDZ97DRAFT_1930928 [Flammula alnicola]